MSRFASVQVAHLRIERIAHDMVCLGQGRYRAVLEVGGVPFGLLGEDEQEQLLASYAAFLNSLAYPLQLLVRVTPLDLDGYLGALMRRAHAELPVALAVLARDHGAFLQALARQRTLLERHHYVVVPADDGDAGPRAGWPFARPRPTPDEAAAGAELATRCQEVKTGLGRCELSARRLPNLELAHLFFAAWCPERSRMQRLRAELVEHDQRHTASGDAQPERRI